MEDSCGACSDPLPAGNDSYAKCSINDCKLHFECAGILETTWKGMGDVRRDSWKCKTCRVKTVTNDGMSKMHEDFIFKMNQTIKEQFEVHSKVLNNRIDELTQSVTFLSGKIDDYELKMTGYDKKVKALEADGTRLAAENQALKLEFKALKLQMEGFEQYNRNRNVQVDGVPNNDSENIMTVVSKLSQATSVNIDYATDIQAAHRVPTKRRSGIKPIIIQFSNRQKRDEFLKKAKNVKISSKLFNQGAPDTHVYINEHLTPYNRDLLYKAKELKENGFKFVWPKDGKVFCRKSEEVTDRTIQLFSPADVDKLLETITQASKGAATGSG